MEKKDQSLLVLGLYNVLSTVQGYLMKKKDKS